MAALIIGLTIGLATMVYVVYIATHVEEKKRSHD